MKKYSMYPGRRELENLRAEYPEGTRVELLSGMEDDPQPLPKKSRGTVTCVDDIGTIHVAWDCGRSIGLVYGVDRCRILRRPSETFTSSDVEQMSEGKAKDIATESVVINDHNVYFADLGGAFGASCLVYRNGRPIYFANDYELHHRNVTYDVNGNMRERDAVHDDLKKLYTETLRKKLFTDLDLLDTCLTYDEYRRKDYFLRNLWIQAYPHISAFVIGDSDKEAKKLKEKTKDMYYVSASFAYVDDKKIYTFSNDVEEFLESERKCLMKNEKTFREAVSYELANHEAGYTGDPRPALGALGLGWNELNSEQRSIVKNELRKQEEYLDEVFGPKYP